MNLFASCLHCTDLTIYGSTGQVSGTDERMTFYLQPAHLEEPSQTDRVDAKAQIEGITADTCCAGSQVVSVNHAACAQTHGQEVIAVQPWDGKMCGACLLTEIQESSQLHFTV